jgi:hypothetical protein
MARDNIQTVLVIGSKPILTIFGSCSCRRKGATMIVG